MNIPPSRLQIVHPPPGGSFRFSEANSPMVTTPVARLQILYSRCARLQNLGAAMSSVHTWVGVGAAQPVSPAGVSTGWGEHVENGLEAQLLYAAVGGNTAALKGLLTEAPGMGVNAADTAGNTALMRAAAGGYTEMVEALLAMPGLDVNAANRDGVTALMRAAKKGHASTVTALLTARGIDVNLSDEVDNTALMEAATGGHTETVTALLAAPGLDVNATSTAGNTALMMAALGGYDKTAYALRRTQGSFGMVIPSDSTSPQTRSPLAIPT